jgi:hypothetical protein
MFRTDEYVNSFKIYSRNTNTTNETTATYQIRQTTGEHLGHLKYINISDSFHLKDLEISKYKRESKARMPITFCCLIFVNCGLFSFLNIIKVKI